MYTKESMINKAIILKNKLLSVNADSLWGYFHKGVNNKDSYYISNDYNCLVHTNARDEWRIRTWSDKIRFDDSKIIYEDKNYEENSFLRFKDEIFWLPEEAYAYSAIRQSDKQDCFISCYDTDNDLCVSICSFRNGETYVEWTNMINIIHKCGRGYIWSSDIPHMNKVK